MKAGETVGTVEVSGAETSAGMAGTQAEGEISAGMAGTRTAVPMVAGIDGVLRGILPEGTLVTAGMKSGDIDPRDVGDYCYRISDKALAVGGGVLEAILHFHLGQGDVHHKGGNV